MSLKTLHQVIIFAGVTIALIFAVYCFFDPTGRASVWSLPGGVSALLAAIGLVGYEIHFLKKTRRLIL